MDNPHAKFEVSSSSRSEILRGSHNSQSWLHGPFPTPFDLVFHFYRYSPPVTNMRVKFEVSNSNRSRDMEGVPKFKKWVTRLFPTLWPIFLFLSLVPLVINLHAKFEVSSSNRSRDMEGSPKILKVGHVTLSRSVSRGSAVNPYLKSSTPICLFTIQLSWGYDWRLRVVYSRASPLLMPFQFDFLCKIWLGHVTCK